MKRMADRARAVRSRCDDPAGELRLLQRVATGDRRALASLYAIYQPRLASFLLRLTGRRDLMEELVNDTMLVVWQCAATFRRESKLSTWIFGIAYRKAMRALKGSAAPLVSSAVDPDRIAGPHRAEAALEEEKLREWLNAGLARLSPEHRAVMELTFFHELDYRTIAGIVDCPVNTVKTRMFHARRQLRKLLPEAGRGDNRHPDEEGLV